MGNELTIDIDVVISPITSSDIRSEFDVVIEYWEEAGLLHPSVARTTKLAAVPQSEFIRQLGTLNKHDIDRIIRQCRKLF